MARSFADATKTFADRALQYRQLKNQEEDRQMNRSFKTAELQTKGINFNPGQRTFSYDPSMSPDYAQQQSVIRKNDALTQQALAKASSLGKDEGLTTTQRNQRDKKRDQIYQTVETNKVNKNTLDNALAGAESVPSGLGGKMRLGIAKALPISKKLVGVDDKMIEDAQELKMALTDATLAKTAHTKGAISDSEMMLFREASANDDFNSPAIRPVLRKLRAFMEADESAQFGSYQKNYGEDPRAWFNDNAGGGNIGQIITGADGKQYRIIGGDPNDPDVEPV